MSPARPPANPDEPSQEKDPLKLSADVSKWMDDASQKVSEFLEQVGTPTLGIDEHIRSYLTRISGLLNEARADIAVQVPAKEE